MFRMLVSCSLLLSTMGIAQAAVQTKVVEYEYDGTTYRGYLAWNDASDEERPGVLVLHEWWGLNDYARKRTEQLAELGYVAFAADIYGGGKTVEHPEDAGRMASHVRSNVQDWRNRAEAGLKVLKEQPQCDADHVAAIGYCFGGSTALQLAYAGADLDAVVTFHAALPAASLAEAKQIKAPLLINHGAADPFVSSEAVQSFREPLESVGVDFEIIQYEGAKHSFTVPGADAKGIEGIEYNRAADEASWKAMQQLLRKKFAQ